MADLPGMAPPTAVSHCSVAAFTDAPFESSVESVRAPKGNVRAANVILPEVRQCSRRNIAARREGRAMRESIAVLENE